MIPTRKSKPMGQPRRDWFAVVVTIIVIVMAGLISAVLAVWFTLMVNLIHDLPANPAQWGRFLGEIARGFDEAREGL